MINRPGILLLLDIVMAIGYIVIFFALAAPIFGVGLLWHLMNFLSRKGG